VRRHRRSTIALALLVAIATGIVLAAFAGARRTDAALPKMVTRHRQADAFVTYLAAAFGGDTDPDLVPELATVNAVPGVRDAKRFTNALVRETDARAPAPAGRHILAFLSMEPGGFESVGRPDIVAGHLPDESRADEVAIDEKLAIDGQLRVGDRIDVAAYTFEQADEILTPNAEPQGIDVRARITGVVRHPYDLRDLDTPTDTGNIYSGPHYDMYLTTAFRERAHGDVFGYNPGIGVTLRDGPAGVSHFRKALQAATQGKSQTYSAGDFLLGAGTLQGAPRANSLQSRALQAFGALAALVALLLVGQALGRQIRLEANDDGVLRAIGMTPGQLRLAATVRSAVVAVAGGLAGLAIAIALSRFFPLPGSTARRAILHPGVDADWSMLLVGDLAAIVLTLAVSALLGGRRGQDDAASSQSRLAGRLAGLGLGAPRAVGVAFALEPGRGRRSVPVRAALVAGAAAVAFVLASAVVGSSLTTVRHDPTLYGVAWDASVGGAASSDESAADLAKLRAIPGVDSYSGVNTGSIDIDDLSTSGLFVRADRGRVTPRIVEGRAPVADDEIALGIDTMRQLKTHVGATVHVSVAGPPTPFRVVGRTILNTAGIEKAIALGKGALFDWSAIAHLLPADEAATNAPQAYLVRLDPRATAASRAATLQRLRVAFPTTFTIAVQPDDIETLGQLASLPAALALVVALLGIATVIHALMSAVSRREHDLAILKTLGLVRHQVGGVIFAQATTFAVISLVVGLPIGLAAGRASWSLAASQLGVVTRISVPIVTAAAGCLGLWVVALAAALIPASRASRVSVATVLRRD
jgi:hypothetical protein